MPRSWRASPLKDECSCKSTFHHGAAPAGLAPNARALTSVARSGRLRRAGTVPPLAPANAAPDALGSMVGVAAVGRGHNASAGAAARRADAQRGTELPRVRPGSPRHGAGATRAAGEPDAQAVAQVASGPPRDPHAGTVPAGTCDLHAGRHLPALEEDG